ncbi:MAG: hypothetical protein KME45_07515 [Stenomitos rutilans HA7619-LM2]|jgi:hypothetical protein|nr:hypothetical protein [Stenomitos rutilans HA7619-LM2]
MSFLSNRQRWFACFLGGLLAAIALSFATMTASQPSAEAATKVWGDQTAITAIGVRVTADAASSHQEPNFYQ